MRTFRYDLRTTQSSAQIASALALPVLLVLLEAASLTFIQVSSSTSQVRISPNALTLGATKCGCLPHFVGALILTDQFYEKIVRPVLDGERGYVRAPIVVRDLCQNKGALWLERIRSALQANAQACLQPLCSTGAASTSELESLLTAGSGLVVQYDASLTESLNLDGTAVSRWSNQVTFEYPASQEVVGIRPVYAATGLQGMPTVQFDGVTQYMTIPFPALSTMTLFVVGSASEGTFFSAEGREAPFPGKDATVSSGALTTSQGGVVRTGPAFSTPDVAVFRESVKGIDVGREVLTCVYGGLPDSWDPSLSLNGESPPLLAQLGRRVSGTYLNGSISELLIFNEALTDVQVSTIVTHLASKWNLLR